MRNLSYIMLIAGLLIFTSCKDEPSEDPKPTFAEIFGEPSLHHLWNMATTATLDINCLPNARSLEVCFESNGRIYSVFSMNNPAEKQKVNLNLPNNIDDLVVIVDSRLYFTKANETVDADGSGPYAGNNYFLSKPLGWILAVDDPSTDDYDFNDLVVRLEPQSDGSITVTALASGLGMRSWLHFYNGSVDYVITPDAYNGYAELTSDINRFDSYEYLFCNWFTDGTWTITSNNSINTWGVGGANAFKGRSVTLPKEMLGQSSSLMLMGMSEMKTDENKEKYAEVTYGFYLTVDAFDYHRLDEMNDDVERYISTSVITPWPAGNDPHILLFPDMGTGYGGMWSWPSENSRIDLVYGSFKKWVADPTYPWYLSSPQGWDDRHGVLNDAGECLYYGYYPRQY